MQRAPADDDRAIAAARSRPVLRVVVHCQQPGLQVCGAAGVRHATSRGGLYDSYSAHLRPLSRRRESAFCWLGHQSHFLKLLSLVDIICDAARQNQALFASLRSAVERSL